MRLTGALGTIGAAALVALVPSASYGAWCANYRVGATNCGFSSFLSCQAAVSGIGGICIESPDGDERPESVRKPQRREKRQVAPKRSEPTKDASSAKPAVAKPPASPSAPAAATGSHQPKTGFTQARQLVLSGQYDAGIAALRALQFDDHPDVATYLGLANRKLGRLDDARTWYERALTADPNHRLAISFYGMLRAETGDLAKAQADLDRLKQLCGETTCNEYQALAGVIAANRKQ